MESQVNLDHMPREVLVATLREVRTCIDAEMVLVVQPRASAS